MSQEIADLCGRLLERGRMSYIRRRELYKDDGSPPPALRRHIEESRIRREAALAEFEERKLVREAELEEKRTEYIMNRGPAYWLNLNNAYTKTALTKITPEAGSEVPKLVMSENASRHWRSGEYQGGMQSLFLDLGEGVLVEKRKHHVCWGTIYSDDIIVPPDGEIGCLFRPD